MSGSGPTLEQLQSKYYENLTGNRDEAVEPKQENVVEPTLEELKERIAVLEACLARAYKAAMVPSSGDLNHALGSVQVIIKAVLYPYKG